MKKILALFGATEPKCKRLSVKLSFLFFMLSLLPINASTYGQDKVSINLENVSLGQVFEEIEAKTSYNIFYKNSIIDLDRKVSLKVSNQEVKAVFEILFENTDINFEILKKQIILTRKTAEVKTTPKVLQTQQREISGKVLDEKGIPLLGATITVKGMKRGTTANFEGEFRLTVPNEAVLNISFIGYESKEVEVTEETFYEIMLKADLGNLNEVVVVGYGTTERQNLTGAVSTVDMENIQIQSPTISLDQALQGQIPGVYVSGATGQPGAPARIRIRGTTSLQGSNQPLYVIDGIPVVPNSNIPVGGREGQGLGGVLEVQGLNTPIGNINANDIASITVLKDASAGAIYGSRAANGVIIVETKSGSFSQAPRFNIDYSLSSQEAKTLDVLNPEQFKAFTVTAVENGILDNSYTKSVLDGSYFGNANTNWEEVLSPSNAVTSDFNLSVQGGSETTRYFSAIGANTQEGAFEGSNFDRYSFKLNLDTKVNSALNIGVQSSISYTDQDALDRSLIDRMYVFRPDLPIFDTDGNYSFSKGYASESPAALAKATNNNQTLLLLTSLFAELEITDGLTAKSLIALNYNDGSQKSFYPKFTFRGGWSSFTGDGDGYAQQSSSKFSNLMWENTLRYDKVFNEVHQINTVIGASFEQNKTSLLKAWGTGYFNDVLTNISSATVSRDASSNKTAYGLESYFGRFNYNYDSRYLISLSARVDGSSKFAKENTHAFFPAAALGWRLSEEAFLENSNTINELKLRASWGVTGQQDFSPYQWRTLYATDDYGDMPAIVLNQLGNDRLKWERSKQFDLGVDYSLFEDRLSGTVGYYEKNTEDAIFTAISPGSTGFSSVQANVGSTSNKGLEFEIRADIIRSDSFNWSLGLNTNKNTNKLTEISDDFKDEDGFVTGFGGGGLLKEGSPIGLIYGYVSEGIFQEQGEIDALNANSPTGNYQEAGTSPGDLRFADLNNDGVVNALDQEVIGDTQPDFFGGFNNTFTYKSFSLSTLFNFSVGNDLHWFNQARSINFANSYFGENKTTEVLNAWTPENPTDQPRVVYGDPNNNDRISSYYVYDASYLRLKTVNLQYSFPNETLKKFGFLNSAAVYVTGQNLLTFTNYPGADPEASNLYNNDISAGRDNNRYPISRVFTAGVKIGF